MEKEIRVDPSYHMHFTARRGEIIRQIAEECGGVSTSFPRPASKSDRVVLKGAKECVDTAAKRIEEIVEDLVCFLFRFVLNLWIVLLDVFLVLLVVGLSIL